MEAVKHICPFCLFRSMYVRLDKKQRPMVQCSSCGLIAFPRNGELGIHILVSTAELLEDSDVMGFVRRRAYERVAEPGSLASLLRPAEPTLAPETSAVPAREAVG